MFEAFAYASAFGITGLDPASRTGAAAHFFIMDVAKIFALLVVVIYIMGLLRALVATHTLTIHSGWNEPQMS